MFTFVLVDLSICLLFVSNALLLTLTDMIIIYARCLCLVYQQQRRLICAVM